ncbi:uncharacterized protein LOC132281007 [Cornus florida]|uniref:uncharacterized protein LOC132281007 n=1 Tax=Cornus florida TaxID=4283 RepID=UPI0028A23D35|nr:uncharacterized protein LOC132281007 [Cornus florida]
MKTLPEVPQSLDPSLGADCSMYLAFGFDYRGNDHKVVEIICFPPNTDKNSLFVVNVYSLSTDSWRRISVASPSCRISSTLPQIMNGAAYWIAKGDGNGESDNSTYTILQFDLGDEVFREIMLPDGTQHGIPDIAVSGELLYLFIIWEGETYRTYQCGVWTMECSKVGTWTKRFTFSFSENDWGSETGFRRNGEILQLHHRNSLVYYNLESKRALRVHHKTSLASYNLENNQAKDLGIFHASIISFLHCYVESLILLGKEDSYSTSSTEIEVHCEEEV